MKRAARIYAILARESDDAIVFRRGPTKQVLLLRWNTANDEIEPGQWLKGRIYERRGDLSPDGRLLIYFASKQPRTWTAISQPPYLTALAMWPKGDAWGGGGHFATNREVLLNHWANQLQLADGFATPEWLDVRQHPIGGRGEDEPVWFTRLERDGWMLVRRSPVTWEKPNGDLTLQMRIKGVGEKNGPWWPIEHSVVDRATGREYDIGRSDWADWDRRGDLLFAADGCLFRARDVDRPQLVADLNPFTFANREPPAAASRWPNMTQ